MFRMEANLQDFYCLFVSVFVFGEESVRLHPSTFVRLFRAKIRISKPYIVFLICRLFISEFDVGEEWIGIPLTGLPQPPLWRSKAIHRVICVQIYIMNETSSTFVVISVLCTELVQNLMMTKRMAQ